MHVVHAHTGGRRTKRIVGFDNVRKTSFPSSSLQFRFLFASNLL
jgi:hypothetical protein